METERLYFADSYLRRFTARVVARGSLGDRPAVALDRSAFYPEGGGQPPDHGALNGLAVQDVQQRDGLVWHGLAGELADDEVVGELDWPRRLTLMQQHHGQHLLSAALLRLLGAATRSVHMGESGSTLDIDRAALSADEAAAVEECVNSVIWEDRPVAARFVSEEDLALLPLRRPPKVAGPVRVVIVPDFDYSACGGTHPRSTGGVGALVLQGWERYKGGLRIGFLCGTRAVLGYRRQSGLLRRLAGELSVAEDDLPLAIARLREAEAAARRGLAQAREQLVFYEAQQLWQVAMPHGALRIVGQAFDERDADELRMLARAIAALPGGVALLGARSPKAQLAFARANDAPGDMGAVLRAAAALLGGKGGGQPAIAQGGGPNAEALDTALEQAREAYLASIADG